MTTPDPLQPAIEAVHECGDSEYCSCLTPNGNPPGLNAAMAAAFPRLPLFMTMDEARRRVAAAVRAAAPIIAAPIEAERDRLRQHILDIDAHATPYGDIPDDPGWVGTYLVTAGSLHRALGKIGHGAPNCQAEADLALTRQAFEEYRASWRAATDATLAEVADLRSRVATAEQQRDQYRREVDTLAPECVRLLALAHEQADRLAALGGT